MGSLTGKPKCIDCGKVSTDNNSGDIWSITETGHWLCNDCWLDSWDNDDTEIQCHEKTCKNCSGEQICMSYQ